MKKNKPDQQISKSKQNKGYSKPPTSKSNQNIFDVPKSYPNVEAHLKTNETAYSFKSATTLAGMTPVEENGVTGGESVKVALRIRPMNNTEISRGDQNCVKVINDRTCHINAAYNTFYLNFEFI